MKKLTIVLLVSKKYQDNPYIDDVLLKQRLVDYGYSADIVDWSSESYDFSRAALCIVRSCWDFHKNEKKYLIRLKKISNVSTLVNDFEIISEYFSKHYLAKMEQKGIRTVPTNIVKSTNQALEVIKSLKVQQIILKPAVSASGDNTYKLERLNTLLISKRAKDILQNSDLVIQPFIDEVGTFGEVSCVVIGGDILFCMLKKPAKNSFLVHEHHGGNYTPTNTEKKESDFIEKILKTFKKRPTYIRIDYLFNQDREPMLLELELNEPNIYLSKSSATLDRLAQEIDKIIQIKGKECF